MDLPATPLLPPPPLENQTFSSECLLLCDRAGGAARPENAKADGVVTNPMKRNTVVVAAGRFLRALLRKNVIFVIYIFSAHLSGFLYCVERAFLISNCAGKSEGDLKSQVAYDNMRREGEATEIRRVLVY